MTTFVVNIFNYTDIPVYVTYCLNVQSTSVSTLDEILTIHSYFLLLLQRRKCINTTYIFKHNHVDDVHTLINQHVMCIVCKK